LPDAGQVFQFVDELDDRFGEIRHGVGSGS
jgi:hypothetical protein